MAEIDAVLRALVRSWANGVCEYCGIPERLTLVEHQIDHVIALKHGGQTTALNLALSCAVCNRFKGSDISSIDPETGLLTPLYHPRVDTWDKHYYLRDGEIVGVTAKGRATATLLRMNRPTRIKERRKPGTP